MEENNQKKKKQLYVVMGALLLVIALVGGTYAYFSASISNTNTIGGNTQNINNNSLTLTVKKVVFNGASAPSNDLVPAYFGTCGSGDVSTYGCTVDGLKVIDPAHLKVAQVSSMLTHKCEQDGFTGCHVYQINISADQNITHANLLLNLSVDDLNVNGASSIEDKSQWGYVVFGADGTVDSSTGATSGLSNPVLNTNNGAPAAIGNGVTNLDIHNDSTLSTTVVTYYLLVYLNDTGASQNNVVSNSGDANYAVGSYSGTLELQALGGKVRACFSPSGNCEIQTAAQYITSLYTNANKSTAEVNGITYNLAPIYDNDDDPDSSGGLMNDRQGSNSSTTTAYGISYNLVEDSNNKSKTQMISDIDAGNIRYYGANPNNYVWLGDNYTSTYEIAEESGEIPAIIRHYGDKKLWRIIGVSNGRLKLIQEDPIELNGLSWDESNRDVNDGYGINQWGPSGNYEGADLMRLLNSGAYWTKSNTYNTYTDTGLSNDEKSMIDTVTWYLGAYDGDASYVDVQYNAERQSSTLGKICNGGIGILCTDEVTRTATWSGKVGLMYPSDYGYAADLSQCDTYLLGYGEYSSCTSTNWLYDANRDQWTLSPRARSSSANLVFFVYSSGSVDYSHANLALGVRPVVYLQSGLTIAGGNGSQSNPYVLQ